jgi:hypothetical protein
MSAGTTYEVAWLSVFDSVRRSDMLRAVVPVAAACLIEGEDVVFHDKFGMTLCVLAAAAVQKSFNGGSMYVSDYKYGFETMGLTCSDPLLICILPKRSRSAKRQMAMILRRVRRHARSLTSFGAKPE